MVGPVKQQRVPCGSLLHVAQHQPKASKFERLVRFERFVGSFLPLSRAPSIMIFYAVGVEGLLSSPHPSPHAMLLTGPRLLLLLVDKLASCMCWVEVREDGFCRAWR